MLEEGSYSAQLVQVKSKQSGQPLWAQFGMSKDGNTLYVVLTFTVKGGKEDGQFVQWTGFLTDKIGKDGLSSAQRAMNSMALVGFRGDDIDTFADQNPPPHGQVEIVTEIEARDGNRKARVKFINPLGGRLAIDESYAASKSDLKAVSARLKADKARAAAKPAFNPNEDFGEDKLAF